MVRDDFSMALLRFMESIGVKLVEGQNFDAVDLFDLQHARKVLIAFGRGYGILAGDPEEMTRGQNDFLDRTSTGSPRKAESFRFDLALFTEMVKGKPWTPETLKQVGGAEGVGVAFLEETFSARSAPPSYHIHQKAAQAVLKALLPESGPDIKGSIRSHGELLEVSGYGSRPNEFDELIRILDPELRLITPNDPEGLGQRGPADEATGRTVLSAHPRLPGSLAAGLADPQAAGNPQGPGRTPAGGTLRALECQAREPASTVVAGVDKHLLLTKSKDWTEPQRMMMRRAGRVHGSGTLVALLLAGC